MNSFTFPQYRKYANNKNYFKLINENEFTEISIIGKRVISQVHQVTIYPDRLFFNDLLNCEHQIVICSVDEYFDVSVNR